MKRITVNQRLEEFASSIRPDLNHWEWERLAYSMILHHDVRFLDHRQNDEGSANRRSELYQAMQAMNPSHMVCVANAWGIINCTASPLGNPVSYRLNDLIEMLLREGFPYCDVVNMREIYRRGLVKLCENINKKNLKLDVRVDETLADDNTPIELLGFSILTYRLLKRKGWHTVGKLCTVEVQDVQDTRGIGVNKMGEIQRKLDLIGRRLQGDNQLAPIGRRPPGDKQTIRDMMKRIRVDCGEIIQIAAEVTDLAEIAKKQGLEAEALSYPRLSLFGDKELLRRNLERVKSELEAIKMYLEKST